MAVSDCTKQALWIWNILSKLELPLLLPTPVCCNNIGAIFLAFNNVTNQKSKHIDMRYHHIRNCIEEKKVAVFFIEGRLNPANMFTKNLAFNLFHKCQLDTGLEFTSPDLRSKVSLWVQETMQNKGECCK
jgi:hypothetical protein